MSAIADTSTSLGRAVEEIRHQHVTAVNAGNVDAATSVFAPDGIFLPPGQPALGGRSQIRAWFANLFEAVQVQRFGIQPAATEEHGDLLIEHGSWSATFQPRLGNAPALPGAGSYLTIYARLPDGSVRIIRDTFNGLPR